MKETETPQNEESDFGAILRHELNNPLTGILGNAELLLVELRRKNVELPPQAQARLETIAALAVRMRETVKRLSECCEVLATSPAEAQETVSQGNVTSKFSSILGRPADWRRTEEHGA
jgi:signal transduction histidine kinase